MRLYHFLSADNALDDLRRARIKLSEIENLNDPFELWCSQQAEAVQRTALRRWKGQMSQSFGLLCFCASWRSPLLWSHYADRHRGMALGFELREDVAAQVAYIAERTELRLPLSEPEMRRILFTKYVGWSYEEEWRSWFRLDERDELTKLYFKKFGNDLTLKEVILGPLCAVTGADIRAAVAALAETPRLVKRGSHSIRSM